MTRACVIAAPVLVLLAACGQPASAPSTTANVTGVLDRGAQPTCPTDEPCDPAIRITTLIFSTSAGVQTKVAVQGDGRFSVRLEPGLYSIAAAPPPFQGRIEPSTVQVPDTGTVFLHLHIARPS